MHEISFKSNKGFVQIRNLPVSFETWESTVLGTRILYITDLKVEFGRSNSPASELDQLRHVRDNILAPLFGDDAHFCLGGWFVDNWDKHRWRNPLR